MEKQRLNVDVSTHLSELNFVLKNFEIRNKIYKLFFRGKSFEFDGFRDYSSSEDVSSIDWKASIRADKLLVKQYREEEELKVLFVIDVGDNMMFGSTSKLKCEYAAELVLSLAHIILGDNNKAGFLLFSNDIKDFSRPSRGRKNYDLFNDILTNPATYGGSSHIEKAMDFISKNFVSLSAVVLVSDFIGIDNKFKPSLDLMCSRYETFAFIIKDPIDKIMPNVSGEFVIEDPNTGEQLLVDPKLARISYEKYVAEREQKMKDTLKSSGVDYLELMTNKPFVLEVSNFLKSRIKRRVSYSA